MSVTKVTADMIASGAIPSIANLEYNQAILAFKVASANQLAKFQMVDQVIDEYQDATGIDASASTNELAGGATTAKYYEGGSSLIPTVSLTGTGNVTTTDGDYSIHKFIIDGTYTTNATQDVEYLVVGGGGAGGGGIAGGGGAGEYKAATGFSVTSGSSPYTIQVGIGGTVASYTADGGDGENSIFSSITSLGGGGGNSYNNSVDGRDGGSGGGGGGGGHDPDGGAATGSGSGNAGGSGTFDPLDRGAGGGGGAGGAGVNGASNTGGNGGIGLANDILVTGVSPFYAGGGGGGLNADNDYGLGGSGVGGRGGGVSPTTTGVAGTANTGGGGGGGGNGIGASGGSGIVVIRRLTSEISLGANLTLQSVATTAESAPTTADLVMLIEDNGSGTATINTDIKAKVSRDGSEFSGYVTLVDEGNWGTDKRILVARDIDISGIASGVAMKYKIETLNQSAGVKETRIHATSLAWA